MKLIGQGSFSKVFLKDNAKEVEVFTVDVCKECYWLFLQDNKLIPKIERLDYNEVSRYAMPLYPKITAPKQQLNKRGYTLYQKLRSIFMLRYEAQLEALYKIEEIADIIDNLRNYISADYIGFEISPRNITCDKRGNLILLDCFFDRSKVMLGSQQEIKRTLSGGYNELLRRVAA